MNIAQTIQHAIHHFNSGDLPQAAYYCEEILRNQPDNAEVLYFLGLIYAQLKDYDSAIKFMQQSLQIFPTNADAYLVLGIAFQKKGNFDDAMNSYQASIDINPGNAETYNNIGSLYKQKSQLDKAITYYNEAIKVDPANITAYNSLGNCFQIKGSPREAEIYYKRAVQLDPQNSSIYQNLLFIMNYNPGYDAKTIYREHLEFARRFERPLLPSISPHANDRSLDRRLKIGYVSPDFKRHSVSYFIEPVLSAHNKEQFEIFCYSLVPSEDEVTNRLRGYADHWQNIREMSDEQAAGLIRNDNIDILVDLAGYTTHNRMLLFARKPAPIQVSWIGYPATTGLSTMDYKIVDHYTDPPGMTDEFYTEKLIRMPESFLCYSPDKEYPDIEILPALTSGYITFGSFNAFAKVSPVVIDLWSEILRSVKDSRLIMKTYSLVYKENRDYILDIFTKRGIAAESIALLAWEPSTKEHLSTYNRIDIALDTYPYNGTTTTCEALWMGVPVVTLAGDIHASRVGMSLLSNIGLSELTAKTPDQYIDIAVNLAKNLTGLQSLRERLRHKMSHSPLMDKNRFILILENYYRSVWEKWCE